MNKNKSICLESYCFTSKLVQNPPYLELFEFEKSVDEDGWVRWFENNKNIPIILSLLYIITIFGIQSLMKQRNGFNLKWPLFLWNSSLALFSIIAFTRGIPEFIWIFKEKDNGMYTSICRRDFRNSATVFWTCMFILSKIVELGDTIFIVLRKKPLIFLHYYHHISVLLYLWYTASTSNSIWLWMGFMNYGIHSIMYSYFALQCLGVKIPRVVSMIITSLQLAQMVMGIYLNLYVLYAKQNEISCDTQTTQVYYGLMMYFSYFILFGNFFRNAYFKKIKSKVN